MKNNVIKALIKTFLFLMLIITVPFVFIAVSLKFLGETMLFINGKCDCFCEKLMELARELG